MQKSINYIKLELKAYYSGNEINSFINLIFQKILNYNSTQIILNKEKEITDDQFFVIKQIVDRLKKNEPIQYILGGTYFYDHYFDVAKNVLIPRPETEELVDFIIKTETNKGLKILDIGTGSGCIAISLFLGLNSPTVYACDVSEDALSLARINAKALRAELNLLKLDILNSRPDNVNDLDIIVSNPPYVMNKEKDLMEANVLQWEPDVALFVDDSDPLVFYKRIAILGMELLKRSGRLYFEINEALGNEMIELLEQIGYVKIEILKDLNNRDRICKAQKKRS